MRKSNRTDNESAKMATGKGVIQGYTGVAAVDERIKSSSKRRRTVQARSRNCSSPLSTAMQDMLATESLITADAGYHSEANLQQLAARSIDALIADNEMRRRDERFATQDRHTALRSAARQVGGRVRRRAPYIKRATYVRRRDADVRVSGRQDAQPKRRPLGHSGQHLGGLSGPTPRLRTLSALARSLDIRRRRRCAPSCFSGGNRAAARLTDRADETAPRFTRRSAAVRAALRDRGTRVRQSLSQQRARALHAPRPRKGGRTVEALSASSTTSRSWPATDMRSRRMKPTLG